MLWTCKSVNELPALADDSHIRHVSDYDVSLVNGSNQEFYVRFYGPAESKRNLFRLVL
jgi:hypothetical protein